MPITQLMMFNSVEHTRAAYSSWPTIKSGLDSRTQIWDTAVYFPEATGG